LLQSQEVGTQKIRRVSDSSKTLNDTQNHDSSSKEPNPNSNHHSFGREEMIITTEAAAGDKLVSQDHSSDKRLLNLAFHGDVAQRAVSVEEDQNMGDVDIEALYRISFQTLDLVYKDEFKKSAEFKKLMQEMHENLIEYRFFSLAGLRQNK